MPGPNTPYVYTRQTTQSQPVSHSPGQSPGKLPNPALQPASSTHSELPQDLKPLCHPRSKATGPGICLDQKTLARKRFLQCAWRKSRAELLCVVQLGGRLVGRWWAAGALDQHLALGTCGLSQSLEHPAQRQRSPSMRSRVYEVGPEVGIRLALSASSRVLSGNLPGAPVSFQPLSGPLLPSSYGMVYVCSSSRPGSC